MLKLQPNQRWLPIGKSDGPASILAAQFAQLRGLEVQRWPVSEGSATSSRPARAPLLATSFAAVSAMTARERESLRASVAVGATLYIRGEAECGMRYGFAQLLDASFTVGLVPNATSYRFTDHPLIPAVLRGEKSSFGGPLYCVSDLSGGAQPLLLARDESGAEHPVVFAYRIGRGAVICDVQSDDASADTPLIWRLADPMQRCMNVGALIACDAASGRDQSKPVAFNLTIDDIPLGYDYGNESMLEDFLSHLERRCGNVHLDCAWIPTSHWIGRRYVELLKSHGAGFVWHGMHRHIDHQTIEDAGAELEAGKRAMAENVARYQVRLQPLIIFPYERAHRSTEELLLKEGFIAGAEQPRHDEGAMERPEYLRYSDASCTHASGLHFLHRYEAAFLTRDRMIAIAALGMPILAFAHPKDVRLRRLSRFVERGGTFSHFDEVLDFAAAKGLPGRSLEAIARELFEQKTESMQLQCA